MTEEQRTRKKERTRKSVRKWQESHRERTRELAREDRATHPEKNRKAWERWKADNPEANKAAHRKAKAKLRRKNPHTERLRDRIRSARRRNVGRTFSGKDIEDLFRKQSGKCAGCACTLDRLGRNKYHVDHIAPLKPRNGGMPGTNDPANLQLLCPTCNARKGNMDPQEWFALIKGGRFPN